MVITVNIECNVTIRVINNIFSGRNKKFNAEWKKELNAVEQTVYNELFLIYYALAYEDKTINKDFGGTFIADSGSSSHIVNNCQNLINLQDI